MTTKVDDFIQDKIRTASMTLTDTQVRNLKSSLKDAGIAGTLLPEDTKLASRILNKHLSEMTMMVATSACPRCHGRMVGTKLATRVLANYCTSCRVVTPQ
jgi:hypothetical protein